MKYLAWLGGLLITFVAAAYLMVFTPFGNGLLQPIVEGEVKEQTRLPTKLKTFSLTMSEFELLLELNKNNTILLKGNYSLLSKAFNIAYRVKLNDLSSLKSLTGQQMQGKLYTDGTLKGDMAYMEIDGKSNLAKSDTTYHVELTNFNPTSIIAKVKDAKLSSLLYMGAQSQYASADINLDVNFKNIKPHQLDGDILLETKNGTINPKLMKEDFNVTIPKTLFAVNLDAKLQGDNIDYECDLGSNLFKVLSSGKVIPEPFKTDIKYSLNIKELAVLKPIIKSELRGAFKLRGTLKGSKEKLLLIGTSDLADSDTRFQADIKEFAPASLKASIKNLKLKKLLYMLNQPHYTEGVISLDADITNAKMGSLQGKVDTTITKGLLNSKYITKLAGFEHLMPHTTFNMTTASLLKGNIVDTKAQINSNLAKLSVKKASYNIDEASIKSDYLVKIPNLDKLFFVTGRHMKGGISADGEFSKAKDLDLTFHSKVAGGDIDAALHNDDLHAQLKAVGTKGLLYMLMYPELFQSTLNAKLDYNLAKRKGVFNGHAADGNFVRNQTFDLIKQYTKFDMYRENFNGDISADINKENILAAVDLRSKQASVKTKNAKINTQTKKISADITLQAKKNVIPANLSGHVDSVKVKIDLKELMKSETGKAIERGINKLFKKFF